jgi:hypothetical protein
MEKPFQMREAARRIGRHETDTGKTAHMIPHMRRAFQFLHEIFSMRASES